MTAEQGERGVSSLPRPCTSIGSRKHAPSLATLRKYADACGQRLVIRFEPKQERVV